ncbi:hypothetical protein GWK47_038926 [Chionoecetes opilio]|uniref:Uncharacterized protein n=1 Tax=Chionoecetes opilio TaxID=41210 RepID=A0A8J5D1L7_CHIOP|nr:hypothetical protein GWK47_038926 [Chionoecetes opilio]
MSALESLVGSLGGAADESNGDMLAPGVTTGGTTCYNHAVSDDLAAHDTGDPADLWTTNPCTSLLAASDLTNPLLTNHHLVPTVSLQQVNAVAGKGSTSSTCTSPSRQSCSCPLCGRHIAQRRSLKQHLICLGMLSLSFLRQSKLTFFTHYFPMVQCQLLRDEVSQD